MIQDPGTTDDENDAEPEVPPVPVLREPRDGVPEPLVDADRLRDVVASLAAGSGPVALDAERASGYRYSQRAYLVQLRRAGTGSALIDPIALPDLSSVGATIGDAEWILHAASQDLPCLAEVGMRPTRLFDTELAGRLLGDERVALGTMVEKHLGIGLEKGHSAADWSTRPLPFDWLIYAALDVELLVQLRDVLAGLLADAGKTEWAEQEFDAVRLAPPSPPRVDPWRRTSSIHKLRNRRQLATVRASGTPATATPLSATSPPGGCCPTARSSTPPATHRRRPATSPPCPSSAARANGGGWTAGSARWPRPAGSPTPSCRRSPAAPATACPPPRGGANATPEAAARLARARDAITAVADEHTVLSQNLLASDVVRRLCWEPPDIDPDAIAARLAELGARPWQVGLTAAPLAAALPPVAAAD